ncbi:MAG: hypothetical protein NDI94_02525, partial [Candidatus Woesearchaeota archaeon]|nr:hypothetical protein [Candidatus Woesearchaeota archaeon]
FNTAYKNNQLIDKYKTEAKISVLSPEKITVPFDSLGSYIIKKGDVVIEKPDEQSYYDALQKFNNMSTNIDFIREYTLACDNLRFPKKIRILDTSRFLSFVKKFSKDN